MNISVFGLGYVGVVTMACLASRGHRMIGVDIALDGGAVKVEVGLVRFPQCHSLEEVAHEHLESVTKPIGVVACRVNIKEGVGVLGYAALRLCAVDGRVVNAR